ncbi:hypothetical protein FOA43_002906 [Brettanomyces nanus]|uniref:Uncharacterized protein n=1 Tax=Eeniella nana TaxID=13502 RepID=A0A875S1D6_EENNA|nr:uncharacterized protein FOA43_002906 [Brettanomyces nanus]QPG75551.1 hypothetical protein FOA43_002906 [Brettanomyces nanus]
MLASARNFLRLTASTACRRHSLLRPVVLSSAANVRAIMAHRQITTVNRSDSQEEAILQAQRRNRPVSPHLDIYEKQLTAVMSALHRITGVMLATGFYGITMAFAAGSLLGHPIDSATLVDLVAGLPSVVDYFLKAVVAFPFVFHFSNGIRHLIWDTSHATTLKAVYTTGYITIGATAVLGLLLMFA